MQMHAEYLITGEIPGLPTGAVELMTQTYQQMATVIIPAFAARLIDTGTGLVKCFTIDDGKTFRFVRKADSGALETKDFADLVGQLILQYIQDEQIRARIVKVTETTRHRVIAAILRGEREGLGITSIAKLIADEVSGISQIRGALIARTEVHAAANFAGQGAARDTGLAIRKEWVSVEDLRTRDFGQADGGVDQFDHRAADGQVVGLDEPFHIMDRNGTTEALMFPGDPNGSAGNVINCRCGVSHMVDD